MERKIRNTCTNAVSLNKPVSWRKTRERRKRRRAQRNRHETRVIQPLLTEPSMKRPTCHSVCAPCVSDAAKTRRTAGSPHDENAVPEILMDCYFARRDDETETVTLLVVEDHYSEPSKHGSSSEKAQISMPLMSFNEP